MSPLISGVLWVLLAGGVSLAQAADAPPIHTVGIDAIARDPGGRFIDDLKIADFELREDGAAKPLDSAQLRRVDGPRLVAIYLDEYAISRDAVTDQLRERLARFIQQTLDPMDRLVVMRPLDSLLAIQLTDDREAARRSIATFEGRKGEYEARNLYEKNFIAGTPARIADSTAARSTPSMTIS